MSVVENVIFSGKCTIASFMWLAKGISVGLLRMLHTQLGVLCSLLYQLGGCPNLSLNNAVCPGNLGSFFVLLYLWWQHPLEYFQSKGGSYTVLVVCFERDFANSLTHLGQKTQDSLFVLFAFLQPARTRSWGILLPGWKTGLDLCTRMQTGSSSPPALIQPKAVRPLYFC